LSPFVFADETILVAIETLISQVDGSVDFRATSAYNCEVDCDPVRISGSNGRTVLERLRFGSPDRHHNQ
jgi:hypothetical protein